MINDLDIILKNLDNSDVIRKFEKGKFEIIKFDEIMKK